MLIRSLVFISLFLASTSAYTQSEQFVQIDYLYSEDLYTLKEQLIANEKTAVYIKFPVDTVIESLSDIKGNVTKNNTEIKLDRMRFFSSIDNDTLISEMSGYENKKYLVYDKLPKQDWQIFYSKTKMISGYECVLAKLEFRGSKFEAYFTPEIPIPFGPYKFKGLSGAILELKMIDDTNLYQWLAVKVASRIPEKSVLTPDPNGRILVSEQEYIETIENYMMDIFKKYGAREGERGVTVRSEMNREGIEKIYEWETTDEKK